MFGIQVQVAKNLISIKNQTLSLSTGHKNRFKVATQSCIYISTHAHTEDERGNCSTVFIPLTFRRTAASCTMPG